MSQTTQENLKRYRNHPDETPEQTINRVLRYIEEEDDDYLTKEDLRDIEIAHEQIKNGEYITLDELAKKHGL